MPSQGTIFYRTTSDNERDAFERLVVAVGLELDDVRPAPATQREPVRFWLDGQTRRRMSSVACLNGVADSTIFRLIFRLGLDEVERALRVDDPDALEPVRMTPAAYQNGGAR